MMCVAVKEFKGNGEMIVRNQLVESSEFRNGDTLIQTRYIRPASEMEIRSARRVDDRAPVRKKNGLKIRRRRG